MTPLQKQIMPLLTLEGFRDYLRAHKPTAIVGRYSSFQHPLAGYLKRLGYPVAISDQTLYDLDNHYILGNARPLPEFDALPLELAGAWLPALLQAFDPHDQTSDVEITAGEILDFFAEWEAGLTALKVKLCDLNEQDVIQDRDGHEWTVRQISLHWVHLLSETAGRSTLSLDNDGEMEFTRVQR